MKSGKKRERKERKDERTKGRKKEKLRSNGLEATAYI